MTEQAQATALPPRHPLPSRRLSETRQLRQAHPMPMHRNGEVYHGHRNDVGLVELRGRMRLLASLTAFLTIMMTSAPVPVVAEIWCDIPYPPENIYGPEESEFRQDIVAEFETYMVDARLYINCLEAERQRMFEEVRVQVNIYGQFLERVKREAP